MAGMIMDGCGDGSAGLARIGYDRVAMTDLPDILHIDGDGQVRFKGSRIRLVEVVERFDEGHSAEGIVVDYYPTLTLAQVYRAIAYYLEHPAEVRELVNQNRAAVELLREGAAKGPTLAELRRRLAARRAEAS